MFLEQKRDDDIKVCRDDLLLMRRLLRDIEKEKINQLVTVITIIIKPFIL